MTSHDDSFMRALYGPNYGKAHHDQLPGEESARSAVDPSRRTQTTDANENSGWYLPSRSIFGSDNDQHLGLMPGAAGLASSHGSDDKDSEQEIDLENEDPRAAVVGMEMSDGWTDTVAAFAASHDAFATDQVLIDAFGMVPEFIEKADQMRVAEILRGLGYESKQKRVGAERQNLWSKLS